MMVALRKISKDINQYKSTVDFVSANIASPTLCNIKPIYRYSLLFY